MVKLNFNKLAWEAPNHDGVYGYIPSDTHYNEICKWLTSCETVYQTEKVNNITTVRKSILNSPYHVMVTYNHTNKMISYYFKKHNEFEV